ncbi:MAG: hypothetical protein WA052_00940 [Microgenomates group bacterium]
MIEECSLAQLSSMEKCSGVPITREQKGLYVFLRKITQGVEVMPDFVPESLATLPVWTMSDQQLLAKILEAADENNLNLFKSAYPAVFKV